MKSIKERLEALVAGEPLVIDAARAARACGCRVLLVGGAVRDLALARPAGDLDFILEGSPDRFLARLAKLAGHRVVTFRKRDIVDHRIRAGTREWDFVETGTRSLRREILRRDFSINAVAFDPLTARILDPGGGLQDLARRSVRALSDGVFRDDPLRMLRAVRIQAEIEGLSIERRTSAMIKRDRALISHVSPERVKYELDRILTAPRPSRALDVLERLGLLRLVLPELDPLRGLEQNRYHHLDAFRHTLGALAAADDVRALSRRLPESVFMLDPLGSGPPIAGEANVGAREADGDHEATAGRQSSPRKFESVAWRSSAGAGSTIPALRALRLSPVRARLLRWALLLHDTGKAETRTRGEDGEYHFYMHERVSSRIARSVLRRFKASRIEIASVASLVELHLRISIPAEGDLSPRALRRIVRDAGHLTPLLALHTLADKIASHGPDHPKMLARLRRAGRNLLETWRLEAERRRRHPRFIDGRDVMRCLGIQPGPRVGRLLAEAEELQIVGDLSSRDEALAWLARAASLRQDT